jgi:AcrR family transcriptional regulator
MGRPGHSEQLVLAAERLFAQHGLDGVSLRQIVTAAGLHNPAAVQYHFKNKAGLLRAVVLHRVKAFNQRRQQMLDELVATGREHDLRGLVEAIVCPLAELEPPGSHYVRFLARLHYHRELTNVFDTIDDEYGSSGRLSGKLFDEALGGLPPALRRQRFSMALDLLLQGLAERQRELESGEAVAVSDDEFLEDLVNCAVGMLSAPAAVAAETSAHRDRAD